MSERHGRGAWCRPRLPPSRSRSASISSARRSSSSTCSATSSSPAGSARRSATTSRCFKPRSHRAGRVLDARARKPACWSIHTREGHRPDLSDAPPAKLERGAPSMRIGDRRADGPHPHPRRARPRHRPGALSARRRAGDRQARQGRLLRDRPRPSFCSNRGIDNASGLRRHHRGLRPTPRCARPTTAATAASCSATAARSYFPEFHARSACAMIKAQGGIFGWVAASAKPAGGARRRAARAEATLQQGAVLWPRLPLRLSPPTAPVRATPVAHGQAHAYARLAAHADPALFISLRDEAEALAEARALRPAASRPLYGVPFAVKDNIDVAGLADHGRLPGFRLYAGSTTRPSWRGCARPAPSSSARPISTSSPPAWSACARPMACRAIPFDPDIYSRAARAPARRSRSPPAWWRSRSAPTPPARAACRPGSTTSSA